MWLFILCWLALVYTVMEDSKTAQKPTLLLESWAPNWHKNPPLSFGRALVLKVSLDSKSGKRAHLCREKLQNYIANVMVNGKKTHYHCL